MAADAEAHGARVLVVNAAGAPAGEVGRLAGVPIRMIPGKGVMVVTASTCWRSCPASVYHPVQVLDRAYRLA